MILLNLKEWLQSRNIGIKLSISRYKTRTDVINLKIFTIFIPALRSIRFGVILVLIQINI
jgi:hypothetical protein